MASSADRPTERTPQPPELRGELRGEEDLDASGPPPPVVPALKKGAKGTMKQRKSGA
jgi:hypothetical protein